MYDYEIRDILRRATTPNCGSILISIQVRQPPSILHPITVYLTPINLVANIGNKSQQPASYAVVAVFIDELFNLTSAAGLNHVRVANNFRRHSLKGLSLNWGVPQKLQFLPSIMFCLTDGPFAFTLDSNSIQMSDFYIGYEILTAGFSTRKVYCVIQHPSLTLQILDEIDP